VEFIYLDTSITLDGSEKALKLKKTVKVQEKITLIENYVSMHQKG
jgi:hypothetical protein